jgi:hypothetical protein
MTDLPRSFQFKDVLDFRDIDMTEPTERDRAWAVDIVVRARDSGSGVQLVAEAIAAAREEGRREMDEHHQRRVATWKDAAMREAIEKAREEGRAEAQCHFVSHTEDFVRTAVSEVIDKAREEGRREERERNK